MFEAARGTLIFVVGLPAILVAAAVAVAWRIWRTAAEVEGAWGASFGFLAGYALTHFQVVGAPEEFPWVLGIGVALAAGEATSSRLSWLPWLLRAAAFPVSVYWLAAYGFQGTTSQVVWIGAISIAAVAVVGSLDRKAHRVGGATVPLVLFVTAIGVSLTLVMTSTARFAEAIGSLAAMAAAVGTVSLFRSRVRVSGGGVAVFMLIMVAVVSSAYAGLYDPDQYYAGRSLAILAVAPHLVWVDRLFGLEENPGWTATSVRVGAVVIGVGVAVGLATAGVTG